MRPLIVVALLTVSLSAHIVVPTEFRQVVADSTFILRGRVTDVRPVAVAGRGIESIATVAVDHVLKGGSMTFVSVHVPGGAIGGSRFVMVGAPTLRTGEEAVFFLRRGENNGWYPVGLSMGVYRVRRDARTRMSLIDPPPVAGQTAALGRIVRGDERRKPLPVSEFESLVRLVMAGASPVSGARR